MFETRKEMKRLQLEEQVYQECLTTLKYEIRKASEEVRRHGRHPCDYCRSQIPYEDLSCRFCGAPQPICASCETRVLRAGLDYDLKPEYSCPHCGGGMFNTSVRPMTKQELSIVMRLRGVSA